MGTGDMSGETLRLIMASISQLSFACCVVGWIWSIVKAVHNQEPGRALILIFVNFYAIFFGLRHYREPSPKQNTKLQFWLYTAGLFVCLPSTVAYNIIWP